MRRTRFSAPLLALLTYLAVCPTAEASVCLTSQYRHPCADASQPGTTCAAAVRDDALDVNARLSLCQAQADAGELAEATITLQRGLEICGQRRNVCNALKLALSNVRELRMEREQQSDPDDLRRTEEALRSYCRGPIATDRTIAACYQLIASNDDDGQLHLALGEKLQKREQPARAILSLRKAQAALGDTAAISKALADAERQRSVILAECLQQGSLDSCDAALLPGAEDEYAVQRQRGLLLAATDRHEQALRAFLTASSLRREDKETARAIIAIDYRRFAGTEAEAEVLNAQAMAFRTLADPTGERMVLERLQALQGSAPAITVATIPEELQAAAPTVAPDPLPRSEPAVEAEPQMQPATIASAAPMMVSNALLEGGRAH
jgi:tetratricopeptide (TPR) repeat protein